MLADATATDQNSEKVSISKNSEEILDTNKTTPGTEAVKMEGQEQDKKSESEEEKELPFHKHPAWQKLYRRNRELKGEVHELKEGLQEVLKHLKGETESDEEEEKGNELKKTSSGSNLDDLLKKELESLADTLEEKGEDFSPEDEKQVADISKKYAATFNGQKIYLPAESAYQIWKDLRALQSPESKPKTPDTRPSSRSREKNVADIKNLVPEEQRKKENFSQMMNRLRRMAEFTD